MTGMIPKGAMKLRQIGPDLCRLAFTHTSSIRRCSCYRNPSKQNGIYLWPECFCTPESKLITCYDHRKSAGAYPLRLSQQLLKWACVKAAVPKKKPFNHSWLDPIEATSCFTRCWAYPGGTRDLHRSIGSFPMRSCQCCHTFWGR